MSDQEKKITKKNQDYSYWDRLIHGKGTVAEPWATPEELWDNPRVQEIIKWNNDLIEKKKESSS